MVLKLGAGVIALLSGVLLLGGCIFDGGGTPVPSASRPSSIPTATPQANPPEPILLGQSTGTGSLPAVGGATGANTYVVKSGDTLFGIAAQLSVPAAQQPAWAAEVLRLNGITDPSLLRAGLELRLPANTPSTTGAGTSTTPAAIAPTATPPRTSTPGTAATAPAGTPTPRPTVAAGASTYTVVDGDYPLLIAQKVGIPDAQQAAWAEQMLALNNATASGLTVGQVLRLPASTPPGAATTPTRTAP
jgi:LysM repeat protein